MTVKKVLVLTISINAIFIGIGVLIGKTPEQYFSKEASYITWVSFFQLLYIAYLSLAIFKLRNKKKAFWQNPALLWGIIAFGFLFLALDEVIRIHENLDRIIHRSFHIRENAFSDRIDDAIIAVYAFIGIGTLCLYKEELKIFRSTLLLFIIGFAFVFLMVGAEMIVNRNDILPVLFSSKEIVHFLYSAFKVLEEALKLFAEAILITAFYYCIQITKPLLVNEKI